MLSDVREMLRRGAGCHGNRVVPAFWGRAGAHGATASVGVSSWGHCGEELGEEWTKEGRDTASGRGPSGVEGRDWAGPGLTGRLSDSPEGHPLWDPEQVPAAAELHFSVCNRRSQEHGA